MGAHVTLIIKYIGHPPSPKLYLRKKIPSKGLPTALHTNFYFCIPFGQVQVHLQFVFEHFLG